MDSMRDIHIQLSLSPETGRGMKVGLFFQQALQELGGGHDRQRRVLLEAFPVVCDYHIATTGESTLILHHVLKVAHRAEGHSLLELRRIHRQDLNATGGFLQAIINLLSATTMKKVRHRRESYRSHTITDQPPFPKVQQERCFRAMFAVVDVIHKDIRVKKYALHRFGLHLLRIYFVRSSESSSSVKFTGCSRNHLVSGDSGTLNFLRAISTRLSELTAAFVSSASSITSLRNVTTIWMSCRLIPRISPIYGAIGVDFTCCAVAVIIFCVLVLRHKGTNNLRTNKTNKKYFRA